MSAHLGALPAALAGFRLVKLVPAVRSRTLWLFAVGVVAELVYYAIASAGQRGGWPGYTSYYDYQAEGFRAGQLSLPLAPPPELLAAKDPYSPAHLPLWYWDSSLYKGKYYVYWGPLPALLLAAGKALLHVNRLVGDQYLVFALFSASLLFALLFLERMARRLFPDLSTPWVVLAAIALAFANPIPYLVASGGVYQAAIAGGQAFLLAGLVVAFDAVWRAHPAEPQGGRLFAAGALWACALASRISVALTLTVFVLATAYAVSPGGPARFRRFARSVLFIGAPLALGGVALLTYNKLRFDRWLEFGTSIQLSTMKFRTSIDYWVPNAYAYLLRPYESSCRFPFVTPSLREALPVWMRAPQDYWLQEPVVGWLRVVPITWLCVAALTALFTARFRQRAMQGTLESEGARRKRALLFCLTALAALATLTGIAVMGLFMATMRYLADVTYGLVLLGIVGAFLLRATFRAPITRALVASVFTTLVLGTTAFGLLLGYQGYNGHFKLNNPALDAKLVKQLSTCRGRSSR
jgi:hypothetical protein